MRLTETQIIRMMRDQYDQHLRDVIKEISEKPADGMGNKQSAEDPGDSKKNEKPKDKEPRVSLDKLSVQTRVTHMPQGGPRGFEYTVVRIDGDSVVLTSGDGQELEVSKKELEKDYVVD